MNSYETTPPTLTVLLVGLPQEEIQLIRKSVDQSQILMKIIDSADEAVTYIQSADVISMDAIFLNDGLNLCRKLHQALAGEPIPIIIISDQSNPKHKQVAFSAGGSDFVVRPLVPQEISAKIDGYLQFKQLNHTLENTNHQLLEALDDLQQTTYQLLAQSEERLNLALSSASTGIWEWEIESGEISWSPQVYEIFQLPEEFDGDYQSYINHIYPEDQSLVQQSIRAALDTPGSEYRVEHRIIRPDGLLRWIEGRGRVIRSSNGQPLRMLGLVTDITDRKVAQDALRLSEERYSQLVNKLPGSAIILFDHDLRFVLVDGPEIKNVNFSKEDFEGKTLFEVGLPPEFVAMAEPNMRAVLSGKSFSAELTFLEHVHTYFYAPLYDPHGRVEYGLILAQNITDLKRSEAKLQQAQKIAQLGSWTWDLQSQVITWTRTIYDIFGVEHDKPLLYEDYESRIHPEDLPAVQQKIQDAIDSPQDDLYLEHRILRDDGLIRFIWVRGNIERDDSGNALSMYGTAQDITEQKKSYQLQAELDRERALNRVKSRFTSMLVHDFRNPLTSLQLGLTATQRYANKFTPKQLADRINRALQSVNQIDALIDDVLIIGKLEEADLELNLQTIDMVHFCRSQFEQVSEGLNESPFFYNFVSPAENAYVSVDAHLFSRAIRNLLTNAMKYSEKGSLIEMKVWRTNQKIALQISDQGIGIPEDDLKFVFDGFFRGSNVDHIKGSGLGLAIVRLIVEAHRGTIDCESTIDKGTTFTIHLPSINPEN
ncbi:MAG: PAS domain-containing protein [Ardenticatenaceae bacterium]|nr:PAS domain-containing protein [Ardenticatenaceae bacterium]